MKIRLRYEIEIETTVPDAGLPARIEQMRYSLRNALSPYLGVDVNSIIVRSAEGNELAFDQLLS